MIWDVVEGSLAIDDDIRSLVQVLREMSEDGWTIFAIVPVYGFAKVKVVCCREAPPAPQHVERTDV